MSAPNPGATAKVWEYDLAYKTSASGKSLLDSVKKCTTAGACTQAKKLTYTTPTGNAPYWDTKQIGTTGGFQLVDGISKPDMRAADLDGDGADDLVYTLGGNNTTRTSYSVRRGVRNTSTGAVTPLSTDTFQLNVAQFGTSVRPLDMNGDGTSELAVQDMWDTTVYSLNKSTSQLEPRQKIGYSTNTFADFNGDGLIDALPAQSLDGSSGFHGTFSIAMNTGGTFANTY